MLFTIRKRCRIIQQRYINFFLILLITLVSCNESGHGINEQLVHDIENRMLVSNYTHQLLLQQKLEKIFPCGLDESGQVIYNKFSDLTSGFYPGCLWQIYSLTKNEYWCSTADFYTQKLKVEQYNNLDSLIGFKIMCSYGKAYKLTEKYEYRKVLINAAKTLVSRYNKNAECLQLRDHNKDKWQYPVIVDNLLSLELLFEASQLSGDPVYYNVACQQAINILKNYMREDEAFHIADCDSITDEVTRQDYFGSSSRLRGQAGILYGFTMVYRETHIKKFLQQAEQIAQNMLQHSSLSLDIIQNKDLIAPKTAKKSLDVAAAAIIASALYELSSFSLSNKSYYVNYADKIMDTLSTKKYFDREAKKIGFILSSPSHNSPVDHQVDRSLVCADYYFLEALNRKITNP